MKTSLLPLAGILPAFLVAPLFAQSPGSLISYTPGSATWTVENTATGTRTIFTISGNSIFEWAPGFNLGSGSELVFAFVGGNSVVNMLGGTGTNVIAGTVISNGNVSFVSPQADLVVSGSVNAKSVTLSALNVDPSSLLGNGKVTFSADANCANGVFVSGTVRSTSGDIVIVGQEVIVTETAKLRAKGAALIAGGKNVELDRGSSGRKLQEKSGSGFVLHMGDTRASRIEVAAGTSIAHKGRLDAGSNRIFLEVGENGKILKEGAGLLIGKVVINGELDKGDSSMEPDEGDSTSALSPSTLKMPAIKRKDGTTVSTERTVVSNVPVSASADSSRDRKASGAEVASRDKGPKPMLQRTSFFGMRGGSEPVKAEKR